MRVIIVLLICIHSLAIHSQTMDIYGGPNRNMFYGVNESGHFNAKYHPGSGFSAGVGIDSVKIDWLMMRLTLQFDQYNGEFTASDGGLGGGYSTSAKIKKSVISLGAFPLNFKIKKRLDINFGVEVSRLIDETLSGTQRNWILVESPTGMHPQYTNYDLNENYDRYSSRSSFGLKARIAYDVSLSKRIYLTPQYSYYFGLSREFIHFPEVTKAMHHYFCIGIKRK